MSAKVTREQVARMQEMRAAGRTPPEIAGAVGVSVGLASTYTRGLKPRARKPVAPGHPANPDREQDIVRRACAGEYLASIARDYGVSGERVRQIITRYEARTGVIVPRVHESRTPAAPPEHKSDAQRLLVRAELVPESGCWVWKGGVCRPRTGGAYPVCGGGSSHIAGQLYAHRAAYRLWRGEIPTKQRVTQECGNELCINPFHLMLLAPVECFRRSPAWDPQRNTWKHTPPRRPQTHCRRGHPFTPENVRVAPTGARQCRTCERARQRRRRTGRAASGSPTSTTGGKE